MDRWQYLGLMAVCLLATLPLELVIGARVYRRPRRLITTLLVVAAPFAAWDIVAIERRHWWFSARYTTGWSIGPLPVEEIVFFLTIPVCALLTFEAVAKLRGRRDG